MKKTKVLLTLVCAVLLVAASVMGTLAYLTSTDSVKNTFTVGNVKITLDETDVDNSTPNQERDQENTYHLLPGHTYTKDPTIHVDANSEDCYLFVVIKNEIAAIEDPNNSVEKQMAAKGWVKVTGSAVVDSGETLYVYGNDVEGFEGKRIQQPKTVTANKDDETKNNFVVFEEITIKEDIDNATLADYQDKTIEVTAFAVQKDGFDRYNNDMAANAAAVIWNTAFKNIG